MTPSLHKHQRKMHSRTGATSMGGGYGRASIPVAHDELQDWPALRGRAGFHGCCTSLLTGAGFNRSAHFSRFMCCAHSPQFERRRRQVGADVLPRTRSVATKFLRDLNSGALAFHTADHSPCRVTDLPPVVQFRSLSSLVASDVKHRDREGFRNVRTPFQGARNDS